ncbi:peptide/nickel transport system ATP-binding protein [Stella humosa]|uniref:Peptide/nickel transport system ATP-binding protein n=1 Tax=Stella humosa TaxID=94 RepID=A0A3N1MAI6_9PROT|nr:oligopeptide/dipeptide ABC transporter ATP-binding protein [Stella humosa]ROQ00279.1 peptide/nickel transport system ATP-binding protein [Stella humosa]BBK30483.1 ABC transporter ATP-binding protein [Stella humosa]
MMPPDDPAGPPVLRTAGLHRRYPLPRRTLFGPREAVHAVNGVDIVIPERDSLGIVGESGCGKSTLARLAMGLEAPSAGSVEIRGEDLAAVDAPTLKRLRRAFQMVFQDPYGSLNPRHTVGRIVAEPLDALERAGDRAQRVEEVLRAVGLRPADTGKYPHEFSGGQRQRIAIARALVTRPALIVLDEPVSALDVSVQAQVLNLLKDLQEQYGLAYMLISHDLGVVDYVCRQVAVMYLGRIVEEGPASLLFERPAHPYTQALRAAVPNAAAANRRRRRPRLQGGVPSQTHLPPGCAFADRCPIAEARCRVEVPLLREIAPGQRAACHLA